VSKKRHRKATANARRRARARRIATTIAVAVLDHEACALAPDMFPHSFTWTDPDEYLAEVERTAARYAKSGHRPVYVFIDPDSYVEWCEETGHPVDSTNSRAAYAGLRADDGIPYNPKQRLWALSVLSMAIGSEVWPDEEDEEDEEDECLSERDEAIVDFLGQLTDFMLAADGTYRIVATAVRRHGCGEAVLWQHFRDAITSQVELTHCGECLSIIDTTQLEHNTLTVADYGDVAPLDAVIRLATHCHGLVGIDARNGDEFTFRAFEIDRDGWRPVPVDMLGAGLGVPGAASLRCGFER